MTSIPARIDPPNGIDSTPVDSLLISEAQAETNAGVARASSILALGNVGSRILGLAREVVLTNLFGASRASDAFFVATIIPKTIYDLLIAGHVNSAIIPVFSEIAAREGKSAMWGVVSILASLVTVILAALTLLVTVFAPQIVALVGSGYDRYTLTLASDLLRLTAPALLFLGIFAIFSGALYALREFRYPALAGAAFNGAIVLFMLLFTPAPGVTVMLNSGVVEWRIARPMDAIQSAALGWLFGALVQLALQTPGMRARGAGGIAAIRFSLAWRNPAVRQIARLYAPVMFSLILDTLVVRTVSYNLASQTGVGSLGIMNWATTLIQFPQGLVATAISIAILPTLAAQAALATKTVVVDVRVEHERAFRDTLGLGLRLAITLILPAAIGLFVLARPIVVLLFEHGAFTPDATTATVMALRLYLVGLPFAAADLLLVYAFYARQDTLTPALIGLFSLLVYLVVALALMPIYGLFSLMIADSVKHIVHAMISAVLLARRIGSEGESHGLRDQRIGRTILKASGAAIIMGVAAAAAMPVLERLIGTGMLWREVALVLASGAFSLMIYFAAAAILRIEEWAWLRGLIGARLQR